MDNFYITFGQKYHHEEHLAGGHPDGWFLIKALSYANARQKVFDTMGDKFAFMYSEKDFKKEYFPKGCLRTIS